MIDREKLRQRFLRDALPVRLGNLSATLGRISSNARESKDQSIVGNLLDEAKHLIEWTAADADITTAAELVERNYEKRNCVVDNCCYIRGNFECLCYSKAGAYFNI